MENKTAMMYLIDKLKRIPDANIKNYLSLMGDEYIIQEEAQIIRAYMSGEVGEIYELKNTLTAKQYYENNYGK